jgi:hypothetical protein
MALSGDRISWLTLARNALGLRRSFCLLSALDQYGILNLKFAYAMRDITLELILQSGKLTTKNMQPPSHANKQANQENDEEIHSRHGQGPSGAPESPVRDASTRVAEITGFRVIAAARTRYSTDRKNKEDGKVKDVPKFEPAGHHVPPCGRRKRLKHRPSCLSGKPDRQDRILSGLAVMDRQRNKFGVALHPKLVEDAAAVSADALGTDA